MQAVAPEGASPFLPKWGGPGLKINSFFYEDTKMGFANRTGSISVSLGKIYIKLSYGTPHKIWQKSPILYR